MALWVVRAGENGEQEDSALTNNVVTIGWNELDDLSGYDSFETLFEYYKTVYPESQHNKPTDYEKSVRLLCGEVWRFFQEIKKGDYVVLPSKNTNDVHVGKVIGDYEYKQIANNVKHIRNVNWVKTISRTKIPTDINNSFNTGLTVFQVKENNAENYVKKLLGIDIELENFGEGQLIDKSEAKVWIYSVDPENWEVVKKHNIWASSVSLEKISERIHRNDYVVFFVTGTKKFGGIFKFSSNWYTAKNVIWADEIDEEVRYLSQIKLEPIAIRNVELWDVAKKLEYFPNAENKRDSSLKLQGKGGYPSNKESLSKKDFEILLNEMKPHYFVALGPWSNWEHSLSFNPVLWGVKPDSSGTNLGEFNRLEIGDFVFFYVTLEKPSKFSKYGFFGLGRVTRKCSNEKETYWPNEIELGTVIYTHRFQIEIIKIIENDNDLLWFDGLPNTKGLAGIKSDNPGLSPLLDAVKTKWNVSFESSKKHYLIQNKAKYPVLRKAEIDKIFDINYARGITDYGRNNYVVVISSLAGIFRDEIGEEFITYTGEGQKERGDQTLTGGNLAIVEAKNKGRKLYFLHELENSNGGRTNDYEFLGEVEYVKHEVKDEPTENRKIISYTLKRIHSPWNIQENNKFTGFDFVHENIHGLPNNSKLISFEKTDDDFYFKGYGYVGNFEQEQCTATLRNLFLPITSKISPFCSEPILDFKEITLKEKLQKIIDDATYGLSGQKSIVLISILYWLSKIKFDELSLVEYLKKLNVKSDGTTITELELLVNNSKLFSDYVLIYKLYQSLGLMKFEIIDRIGYHIKQSLEMNNNSDRLISDFSRYDIDSELSQIVPERAKVLLYSLLKDNLDESTLNDFWGGMYGKYHTIKCPPEILEKIKNMSNFDPESAVIQINPEIYGMIMSQFSNIYDTKPVEGKLRIPSEDELSEGIRNIKEELLIDEKIIREIVTHLCSGRHVLLAGAVGTGKTRLSQILPNTIWTEHCGYFSDVYTATSDWSTHEVIGGLMPKENPENNSFPKYEIEDGCVTKTIKSNYNLEFERHTSIQQTDGMQKEYYGTWLVIDEFNRADIDKAFGPLFTALEYKILKLPTAESSKSEKEIQIPADYRIIGTLNTADKHFLFNLSDALKRRFAYVEVPIPTLDDKDEEIRLATFNALKSLEKDLSDNTTLENILEIKGKTINYKKENIEKIFLTAYDVLELIRAFKPLGTAILKSIFQTIIISEKMNIDESLDNAINANIIPQIEDLEKPTLELLIDIIQNEKFIEKLSGIESTEKYKTGFEAVLNYVGFEEEEIPKLSDAFLNQEFESIKSNFSSKYVEKRKKVSLGSIQKSRFTNSIHELINQSEII